eukprot:3003270-Rhodomonas_salina.1
MPSVLSCVSCCSDPFQFYAASFVRLKPHPSAGPSSTERRASCASPEAAYYPLSGRQPSCT